VERDSTSILLSTFLPHPAIRQERLVAALRTKTLRYAALAMSSNF